MNIYHLNIKDNDDAEYDINTHFGHPTKTATELYNDYHKAYDYVISTNNEWGILDILQELKNMGWNPVDIEKVEVDY